MKIGREHPITTIWIPDARAFLGAAFALGYTGFSTKAKVLIGEWIDRLSGGTFYKELLYILLLAGLSAVMGYGMWKSSNGYAAKVQTTLYNKIICKAGDQP